MPLSPNRSRAAAALLLAPLLISAAALAADWPQLLGPDRNGTYGGPGIGTSWAGSQPPVDWTRQIGDGFSGPAVADGRVVVFYRRGGEEIVEALDAQTGEPLWKHASPTSYHDDFGFDPGPRATPVIAGGKVYTFGAQGVLTCLRFSGGRKLWAVKTHEKFGVRKGFFGAACTPLVEDGRVFLNVGGRGGAGLAAFDAASGELLWTSTGDEASYSSPVAAEFDGRKHILFFTREGLVAVEPESGKPLFRFPWRSRSRASVNAATPLVIHNQIFISASYRTGAALLRVRDGRIEQLWASDSILSNHYATSVHREGYLYGFHGRQEYGPSLRCVELRTGRVMWHERRFGAGTVTLAGDKLVILRENGELLAVAATPEGFKPLARAQLFESAVRAYPALAEGFLYARDTEGTLLRADLRK